MAISKTIYTSNTLLMLFHALLTIFGAIFVKIGKGISPPTLHGYRR